MRKLVALVAGLAVVGAIAGTALANNAWGNYHWARTSNPFTLKVGDNVSSSWDSYLDTTISDWTQSTVLNLTKVTGSAKGSCRPTSGRIEVCNKAYGNTGWLGIAQIWLTGGSHISQGTTKVNDTYFNTSTYNTPAWRNLVMCQEVGHDLGLAHQDENFSNANLGTCMDYTNNPTSNQHPNAHDYAQLVTIYTHLDSTSTVSSAPSLPGKAKPFSQASRANGAVYVDHLPGGVTLLTHVFWTPE